MSLLRMLPRLGDSEDFDFFKKIMHLLAICLSDLSAGTMHFSDVLGINRQPNFKEFVSFLQTMEVYGSGYADDVDYFKYNRRNSETHTQAMVKQLKKVVQCYELVTKALEIRTLSGEGRAVEYKCQFLSLLTFQYEQF